MSSLVINPIHTDLVVTEMEKSIQFYRDFLNYEVIEDAIIEGDVVDFLSDFTASKMRLVFLSRNRRSTMLELIQFEPNPKATLQKAEDKNLQISLSYLVDDLPAALLFFKEKGLTPVTPVFKISLPKLGSTQIIFFRDPNNYLIELVAPF